MENFLPKITLHFELSPVNYRSLTFITDPSTSPIFFFGTKIPIWENYYFRTGSFLYYLFDLTTTKKFKTRNKIQWDQVLH